MHFLWSEQHDKYIWLYKNSLSELKQAYKDFCDENENEEDDEENSFKFDDIQQKNLDTFSEITGDDNIYYSNDEEVDANKPVYIFTFDTDKHGCYHETIIILSNDKYELLEIAKDTFMMETNRTEKKEVDKMLKKLNKTGVYCTSDSEYLWELEISSLN